MPERLLIPSIEQRLAALLEVSRRAQKEAEARKKAGSKPTITISREFGCEAYPVAERLKALMEEKSGETWALMDKALLEKVAKDPSLSESVLKSLGEKPRFLDELLSTLSPRWKSEKDQYRLLCRHIASLATGGNVILVGRGGAVITQALENCFHFRMFASPEFKARSIARRMRITQQEAEIVVEKEQRQRDRFIRNFLNQDAKDLSFYHLVFNNDKNSTEKIARTMADYVMVQ